MVAVLELLSPHTILAALVVLPPHTILAALVVLLLAWAMKPAKKVREIGGIQAKALAAGSRKWGPVDTNTAGLGIETGPNLHGAFIPSMPWHIRGNNHRGTTFDNEFASGLILVTHRPTWDKALDKSGDWIYGAHYKGRKRLWEHRLMFRFKQEVPAGRVVFGLELEEYVPFNMATQKLIKGTVAILRSVIGSGLYDSVGDDPKTTAGEVERPVFAMPLLAFDQFIETPEGEEPPDLHDPLFSEYGRLRTTNRAEYCKMMDELDLKVGPAYTFSFYGISQFLDLVQWQVLKVVPMVPIDFNTFCGKPPVHLVVYTLSDPVNGETRHLQSRKSYYLRMPLWSSKKPPSQEVINALLPERKKEPDPEESGFKQRKGLMAKVSGAISCCMSPERVRE